MANNNSTDFENATSSAPLVTPQGVQTQASSVPGNVEATSRKASCALQQSCVVVSPTGGPSIDQINARMDSLSR